MSQWYREGKALDYLPVDDRAVQYGDGLFETIAVRNGKPRLVELHLERLVRGCERLHFQVPDTVDLQEQLATAIDQSHEVSAYCVAKVILSSGVSQRGYGRVRNAPASVIIGVFPARPVAVDAYRNGVETMLCETRLAAGSPTAGLKTLNRIEQVLGRSECLEAGTFEGVMLDAEDRLICGTMSNVFIVTDQQVVTPSLKRCGVAGVMRRYAIESLKNEGTEVLIRDIASDELFSADEVFLTNSQFGALPVVACGERTWLSGEITKNALAVLATNGITECAV